MAKTLPPTSTSDPRVFLGWDKPVLPMAAGWLLDHCAAGGSGEADLSNELIVVPGSRAMRRLSEVLAVASAGRAMVPPQIITLGALAGRLMPMAFEGFAGGVVGETEAWLTRAIVLRGLNREVLSKLTPHAPAEDDWPGWWSLAKQLGDVADELGAGLILPSEVRERCDGLADDQRWEAIEQVDRDYHEALSMQGKLDPHYARRLAIEQKRVQIDQRVILLATHDLMPVHRRMLDVLASGGPGRVVPLIFGPVEHADGFDRLGGFKVGYWREKHPPIDEGMIEFADRPRDQAGAVLSAISRWSTQSPTAADQITIGIGGQVGGIVQRSIDLAGLPARSATGQPAARSRPALFLQGLSAYANRQRFNDLASLLRHPDVEDYVKRWSSQEKGDAEADDQRGDENELAKVSKGVVSWLGLLDRYATEHLQGKVTGHWLGDQDVAEPMRQVYDAVQSLLPSHRKVVNPLPEWAGVIGECLDKVFGYRELSRFADGDRPVVIALEHIGRVLREMEELPETIQLETTFSQAVRYVLERIAGRPIAEPGGEPAIELVGFLELLLDDAPRLAIVGMNEGAIPEPTRFSPLLPDSARRELGLAEDEHRLVRDKLALTAILSCREGVKLITGRRSAEGDPLLPSRLLLQANDEQLTERVSKFFSEEAEASGKVAAPLLLTPGKVDRFLIPYPTLGLAPINRLRVTAFRDYLACPYRFYLKHILKLRISDDREVELNAAAFGNLAHDTLRILHQPQLVAVDDPGVIAEHLSLELDRRVREKLGGDPPAATRLQAEQLRYRLEAAAEHHARMVAAGWQIAHSEMKASCEIQVDGQSFTITGTVDRIDQHPELGYRIIDYKTGDTKKTPEQTHRKKMPGQDARQWTDLQLPLYLDLTGQHGVPGDAELGYFNLPKKWEDTGFAAATWDAEELQQAKDKRDEVIRAIRGGLFWQPSLDPPRFDDGFSAVAADHAANRLNMIARSKSAEEV